ncbi:MAG TPA: SGNH/GDSL hydrolase family protein, partial [Vicinamibacteria bacterium]
AGTNTWKARTEVLRDAWFANRQNGGADFRIAAPRGASFALDLVYVRVPAPRLPAVRISPAQGEAVRPQPWRDLCARWGEWPVTRASVDMVGSADHLLASVPDGELARCFARISAAGLALSLEVPVLKDSPDCRTGPACFEARVGVWDRLERLGAVPGSFYMDEPLLAARAAGDVLALSDAEAVNQVVSWMRLVRARSPHAKVIGVEPYPALPADDLAWWLRALHDACAAHGVPVLDFFVLDHDWTASGWSFPGIAAVQAQARALGVPFGVLFWAADKKTSRSDADWRRGLLRQGRRYQLAGIAPELYDVNDFLAIPAKTVPENDRSSFTYAVKVFVGRFVRRDESPGRRLR